MFVPLPFPNVSMIAFSGHPDCETLAFDPVLYHRDLDQMGCEGQRQIEFLWGRHAAHAALRQSGAWSAANTRIGRDEFGAPQWPQGWTGSISHSRGTFIAATASTADYLSLGVDVETARGPGLARAINRLCLSDGDAEHGNPTVLFSAKEAIYKAVHPHIGGHLWFTDFTVHHFDTDGQFEWSFNLDPRVSGTGHYFTTDDLVLTCVTLPCDHMLANRVVTVRKLESSLGL